MGEGTRARLTERFEAAFGIPCGPLMTELLVREADAPFLETLDVALLGKPNYLVDPSYRVGARITPENVVPFAETRGGEQFAFLSTGEPERSTDQRPICMVAKDWPTTRVIAPDLAGFLCVLAVSGAFEIGRDTPDSLYFSLRDEILSDDEHRDDFRRAVAALCTLPGVLPARSPREITNAHPDIEFPADPREEEPLVVTLPRVRDLLSLGREQEAARTLRALVERWLELGELVPSANWASLRATLAEVRPDLPDELWEGLARHGARP
jgi:hypothetical protein